MIKKRIKDNKYKEYIEKLPCYLCGCLPKGTRKLYSEYQDKYYCKPCKNTAHHVDNTRTRATNDHKVLPMCGHYIVSGRCTHNCHNKVHSEAQYKTKQAIEQFNKDANEYYEEYLRRNNEG